MGGKEIREGRGGENNQVQEQTNNEESMTQAVKSYQNLHS